MKAINWQLLITAIVAVVVGHFIVQAIVKQKTKADGTTVSKFSFGGSLFNGDDE